MEKCPSESTRFETGVEQGEKQQESKVPVGETAQNTRIRGDARTSMINDTKKKKVRKEEKCLGFQAHMKAP